MLDADSWLLAATEFADDSEGTENDPIEIASAEELAYLSLISLNGNYNDYYYKLMADIDLDPDSDGKTWFPIGSDNNDFQGHFDGNDKTISNLTIDSDGDNLGLFGSINNASISDLTIDTPAISGTGHCVGAICGLAKENSTISNCAVENGSVAGRFYVGGVIGRAEYSSTVSDCHNSNSTISGTEDNIGGVSGSISDHSSIEKCYNNTGSVSGNYHVGGVSGEIYEGSAMLKCYNTGGVSGDSDVGGVVGIISYSSVTACYNTGDVISSLEGYGCCGGVTGYFYNSESNDNAVTSCYNVGSVTGPEPEQDSVSSVGAVIGSAYESGYSATECYYLPAVASITDIYGGVSLTSVINLNTYSANMNSTAAAIVQSDAYTAGGATILPSLMDEDIEFNYTYPKSN